MSDRKYRHRGYMDGGRDEPRPSPAGGAGNDRPSLEGAPRGRGADLEKTLVLSCKRCGEKIRRLEEVGRDSACPGCGADLHACVQCRNFDGASRWECLENTRLPARVADKNRRNDCALFAPAATFDMTGARPATSADDAKRAFDALFRKR